MRSKSGCAMGLLRYSASSSVLPRFWPRLCQGLRGTWRFFLDHFSAPALKCVIYFHFRSVVVDSNSGDRSTYSLTLMENSGDKLFLVVSAAVFAVMLGIIADAGPPVASARWGFGPGLMMLPLAALASWKSADLIWIAGLACVSRARRWYAMQHVSPVRVERRRPIPGWKRFELARSQGFRCAYCWHILPRTVHIDHIRPLHCSGLDQELNWHVLCPSCHDAKTVIDDPILTKFSRYTNPITKNMDTYNSD
jgi:hypothetical protein